MKCRTAVAVSLIIVVTAPACSRGGGTSGDSKVPFVAVDASSSSPTDQAIAKAQQRLRVNAKDASAQLALAEGFLQKARETADPTLYTKATKLLDLAAKQSPNDTGLLIAKGTLALAQHRFADALKLGHLALNAAPSNQSALGVIVDADNELGHYGPALAATQQMVDVRPDLASYSRVSYERELHGDLGGAVLAMTQAVSAGATAGGENVAYVDVLLGNLLVTQGRLGEAGRAYDDAERAFPGFPAARAGRARLLVAEARYADAARMLDQVLQVQPLAEYAIAQGEDLQAAGKRAEARRSFELVAAIAKLYRANGVNVDLELALFDADHNPGKDVVKRARKALDSRPSILGHDVLAWSLFRAGDAAGAAKESRRALSTGTHDPLLRFHAAAIADANGDRSAAASHLRIVLGTNPRFSAALAGDVERLARKLGLSVPPPSTASG